jgi:3-hydroxyisobutyrate dehydrogenase
MRVAFLGLGRMGAPMAAHVIRAGHETTVWNRSPGKTDELVALGATAAGSVAEAVGGAEVVVTMLFGPEAAREVLSEVLEHAPRGALVIESSTIGPEAARELGAQLAGGSLRLIDAPVVGTTGPAQEGTLGVLVGGTLEDYNAAKPLLELWGDPAKVRRIGDLGAGSAMKLVINITIGVAAQGLGEALSLASTLGVDRTAALDVLQTGPFGFTTTQKRAMLDAHDFSATGFSLDLLTKDLELALRAAGGAMPATSAALGGARGAVAAGHGDEDYSAMVGWLEGPGSQPAPYFSVVLDCADPERLAGFYSDLLGLPVVWRAGAFVVLRPVVRGTAALIFQKVDDPERGKSTAHIDLHIADLEASTKRALELGGAVGEDVSDVGMSWRTMRDPEGNTFCLVPADAGSGCTRARGQPSTGRSISVQPQSDGGGKLCWATTLNPSFSHTRRFAGSWSRTPRVIRAAPVRVASCAHQSIIARAIPCPRCSGSTATRRMWIRSSVRCIRRHPTSCSARRARTPPPCSSSACTVSNPSVSAPLGGSSAA